MEPRIEKMDAFYVMGREKQFNSATSFKDIPPFWCEYFQGGYDETVCGCYGICFDDGCSDTFAYMIGDNCNENDEPQPGFVKKLIPAHTWAKFTCKGAIPDSIQNMNRYIYREWLPQNKEYAIAAGLNIEMYTMGDTDAADYISELWIPVKRKA